MTSKYYICTYETCPFETAKRKAIYTHLVRTHSERKEDYECEYCSTVFEDEALVEEHLVTCHPDKQFTYTCVSRIENVINQCAENGSDKECAGNGSRSDETRIDVNEMDAKVSNDAMKPLFDNSRSLNRTKATVNASLNNLVAMSQVTNLEQPFKQAVNDTDLIQDEEEHLDSYQGGLKVKLNLKRQSGRTQNVFSKERSKSPPKLEPASLPTYFDSDMAEESAPPNIVPSFKGSDCVSIREKSSKYFDRLEVYHKTDEHGRRCCPFCPYKTTKNTIRVHLSGIHKIYFVKCSLCEYKAAFPHQVTQHGFKFHKTTNLNVIQLSKESRERTIFRLNNSKNADNTSSQSYNYSLDSFSGSNSLDDADMLEEADFSDHSSGVSVDDEPETEVNVGHYPRDERHHKPPRSQMSKTDYFTIKVENGVHQYSCNLCPFKTPVRATIYTHKYRHEDKNYKCGYCDFISAPRSNVVHHLRTKHKNSAILVSVVNDDGTSMVADTSNYNDVPVIKAYRPIKQEVPCSPQQNGVHESSQSIHDNQNRDHPTIIKVPQYKRTLTSVSDGSCAELENPSKRQKAVGDDYKLSLNKLYKVNPHVSPKYICVECSYGCDTHPKMKHHLYRHRPQQFKCPYCDHRKYPRSYVVRHVRDTHRDKPIRVIDLSKGPEPMDIPEYMDDNDEDGELPDDTSDVMEDGNDHSGVHAISDDTSADGGNLHVKKEPENTYPEETAGSNGDDRLSYSLNNTTSIINTVNKTPSIGPNLDDDDDTNDVSPNFSEVVYTSTPLIESLINGKYGGDTVDKPVQRAAFFRKKSLKDYRINCDDGPKYICNICDYGTENYKTIHNHMYRHESQKFQCPYCGYRRSPKSFVENHIREVHRGHPIFVTELREELEDRAPLGSPRQCIMNLKKKEHLIHHHDRHSGKESKDELNLPNPSKLQIKWPAPKPVSRINCETTKSSSVPKLQMLEHQKAQNDLVVPNMPIQKFVQGNHPSGTGNGAMDTAVLPPDVSPFKTSGPFCLEPLTNGNQSVKSGLPTQTSSVNQRAFKFKEPSRTTFKTMYKCVFDPESCNHISKDKSKMKQHLFMHVEYKPWTCDLCEMTASQSSHIKNHVRTEHYGVSDMSFKYKKHNYLEKHIDTFLTKGLFTVPVKEYRMIMNMKGNSKASFRTVFDRDSEGFMLCPYCDYKSKGGTVTDHVKTKHMQPRFKCHWCFFKAFYRSEIRRHHRKERTHAKLEFKIQELDLKEVAEEFSEGRIKGTMNEFTKENPKEDESCETEELTDRYCDDDGDDDNSSNEDLSEFLKYSSSKGKAMQIHDEKSTDQTETYDALENESKNNIQGASFNQMECQQETKQSTGLIKPNAGAIGGAKFKCGYCTFSADLRMKVKMHCGKKHTGKTMLVIEPAAIPPEEKHTNEKANIMRVNCSELKGTRFEKDLKKAGVSMLNLASLFPSKYGDTHLNVDGGGASDEGSDDSEDDNENLSKDNDTDINGGDPRLETPFKIPLSNKAKHMIESSNLDSNFKKPSSPAIQSKKKESNQIYKQSRQGFEERESTHTDKSEATVNDMHRSKPNGNNIVVEPLGHTGNVHETIDAKVDKAEYTAIHDSCANAEHGEGKNSNTVNSLTNCTERQKGCLCNNAVEEKNIIDGPNMLSTKSDKDWPKNTITLQEQTMSFESKDNDNKVNCTENDQSLKQSFELIEDSQNTISIVALDINTDFGNIKPDETNNLQREINSDLNINNTHTTNQDRFESETCFDEDEMETNGRGQNVGRILEESVIQKTFPRGSPVVLEVHTDDEEHALSVINDDGGNSECGLDHDLNEFEIENASINTSEYVLSPKTLSGNGAM